MLRLNLLLTMALLASALYLVRNSYEWRKLNSALETERIRERQLRVEFEQLEVSRRAQATPLRVEKIAREKLHMFNASPALTSYVGAASSAQLAPGLVTPAASAAPTASRP